MHLKLYLETIRFVLSVDPMSNKLPYVSVIVPVLNGEKTIEGCLYSLTALDYPSEKVEIIIIDNGSTDKTNLIVSK